MGRKLYVGNFPYSTGEAELQTLFATAGEVDTVKVVRDGQTGQPRGFAFIEMKTDADAAAAISALHGHEIGGRALAVNEARPKPEFGGGGGRDGGGRGFGGGGGRNSGGGGGNDRGGGGGRGDRNSRW
jgi:cold-inducible RNA-binding protein